MRVVPCAAPQQSVSRPEPIAKFGALGPGRPKIFQGAGRPATLVPSGSDTGQTLFLLPFPGNQKISTSNNPRIFIHLPPLNASTVPLFDFVFPFFPFEDQNSSRGIAGGISPSNTSTKARGHCSLIQAKTGKASLSFPFSASTLHFFRALNF